jgi:CubicO group peptidase (beta-lactamase class C family)
VIRAAAIVRPLLVAAAACAATTIARADVADRIDAFVRAEVARQRVPGVAVAVVHEGEVVVARGYGYANVEHAVPVTPETIYQSGSVGKQFTAALVMLLVEDGKLGLDDSIRDWLPEAPPAWQPITIRHLLTHTSGIPDYTAGAIDYRRDYTEQELTRIAYGLPLAFAPGARWSYSNTGYLLLGVVVHAAAGGFYGDLLRERVFRPLGMRTARIITEADIVPHRAEGYQLVDGELKHQDWVAPSINTTADGSLYLSLDDMLAWERALRAGSLLKTASWAQVYEPVRLASGNAYPYGFGWDVDDVGGERARRHGGSWQGFRTYIARFLDADLTIVVLANLAESEPYAIVEGIAAMYDRGLGPASRKPIADREPAVTARLVALLASAQAGTLPAEQFAWQTPAETAAMAEEYAALLRGLGAPTRVDLIERRKLGDDDVHRYVLYYGEREFDATLAVAPDGRIAELYVSAP